MKIKTPEYEYTIFLTEAEGGGYIADVPSLPGCMTQGETLEETIIFIKDAIELYLKALIDRGRKIPVENGNVIIRVKGKIPRGRKTSIAYS
ncbi:MAG: type II toxin-antitoxin system HicB family antitoxin [Ignavibacteriales bacterium]|nr:type II toxin-antitoxin system HicB family antitoxin [Ignavibacteriales bacterium]